MIRRVTVDDALRICEIYNYYVESTVITFEEKQVKITEMQDRIRSISVTFPWLVYERDDCVIGYAYASRWKSRCSYRYSVESTVYVSSDSLGVGIGTELYGALIEKLRLLRLHSVIGGIALPNPASISLHEKLGFEKVAHFKEVGYKMNSWIDVGYWELIL